MKKWGSNPRDGVLSGAGDFRYREVGGGVRKRQKQQTQIKTMKTKTIDSMNRTENRKVLDCASPLALCLCPPPSKKRQRTGALQEAGAPALSRSYAPRSPLYALLGLGISLLAPATFAQTWQTVDDFQYVSGMAAENSGLCVAPSGTLLAAGWGNDSTIGHALVMASSDGGNSWSAPLDDFLYQDVTRASYVGGIVADASGNLYAAGCAGIEFLTSR